MMLFYPDFYDKNMIEYSIHINFFLLLFVVSCLFHYRRYMTSVFNYFCLVLITL